MIYYQIWFKNNLGVNQMIPVEIHNDILDDVWHYIYKKSGIVDRDISIKTANIVMLLTTQPGINFQKVNLACSLDTLYLMENFYDRHDVYVARRDDQNDQLSKADDSSGSGVEHD